MGGIAKGSGMIAPNMATMLCFITTDAAVSAPLLKEALAAVAADTFNMMSVDGDTSTNDTLAVMANGAAGNAPVTEKGADYDAFFRPAHPVHRADQGPRRRRRGATKLLECRVTGGKTTADAKTVAKAVINSALLKAAMFGADANWGPGALRHRVFRRAGGRSRGGRFLRFGGGLHPGLPEWRGD